MILYSERADLTINTIYPKIQQFHYGTKLVGFLLLLLK